MAFAARIRYFPPPYGFRPRFWSQPGLRRRPVRALARQPRRRGRAVAEVLRPPPRPSLSQPAVVPDERLVAASGGAIAPERKRPWPGGARRGSLRGGAARSRLSRRRPPARRAASGEGRRAD